MTDRPPMVRVKKDNPCPICGKPDYCLIAEDGNACICARISDGSVKKCGEAGWLFKLTDTPQEYKPVKRKPKKKEPVPDFFLLSLEYYRDQPHLGDLSQELGLTVDSLARLRVGWDGKNWTFPMRDGNNRIVGIRLRGKKKKFAVKGSKNALFWPAGVQAESDNLLFICEGPTDTAALLDLGFDAIGRASCNTGAGYIKTMIGRFNRKVVIMGDKDEAKTKPDGAEFYPGIEGAMRLAEEIKAVTQSIRVIKPPHHKDIRKWCQNGATKAMVMLLVDNARFERKSD